MGAVEQAMMGSRVAERPGSEREDWALVEAVREGDDRAFEELYERYHSRISAFVRSLVKDHQRTEDVTQEVFLSALRRLRQTRAPIAVKAWLYEIARNACIDQHRRESRAREVPLEEDLAQAPHASLTPSPDAALHAKEQIDHLCDAFAGLTPTQHEMLIMREFEGRSYRDIGERLNLTKPAVESALFRARRRLLQEYQELRSGVRCARVQRAIRAAPADAGPIRDWRLAMHVSRCRVCGLNARRRGLRFEGAPPRSVAALLGLPGLLPRGGGWRGRWGGLWAGRTDWSARWSLTGGADATAPGLITAGAAVATVALALGSASVLGAHAAHPVAAVSPGATLGPARPLSTPPGPVPDIRVAEGPSAVAVPRRGGGHGAARGRAAHPVAVSATRPTTGGASTPSPGLPGSVGPHPGGRTAAAGSTSGAAPGLGLVGLRSPSAGLPSVGASSGQLSPALSPTAGLPSAAGGPGSSGAPSVAQAMAAPAVGPSSAGATLSLIPLRSATAPG